MATDTSATTTGDTLTPNIGSPDLTDSERADFDANWKPLDAPIDPTTGAIDYSIPAKAAGVYIPPQNLWFRLINYQNSNIIVSRYEPEPQVGTYYINDTPVYDDQWFSLIPGTGSNNGLFLLRSKHTGNNIYSRNSDPWVWHIEGNGDYSDNWFTIEPGTGQWEKNFRLFPPSTGLCILARGGDPGRLANYPLGYAKYGDQYWSYLFEDMDVVSVTYDLNQGKIASQTALTLVTQVLDNRGSSTDQEQSFQVSESVAETSEYRYSSGFTMTIGTEFTAGIPEVASASASFSVSTNQTWEYGKVNTTSKTYSGTFPLHAKAGTAVEGVATVSKGNMEVPYTITLRSKSNGVQTQMKGIWYGVTSWDLRCTTHDI